MNKKTDKFLGSFFINYSQLQMALILVVILTSKFISKTINLVYYQNNFLILIIVYSKLLYLIRKT